MASKTYNVLITGATGYIGGSIFTHLVANKSYHITALCRDKAKGDKLEHLGAKALIGSLDDSALLEEAARNADIVIHTADSSDHEGSCKALLAGLKSSNKKPLPIYIHVSGTGVLCDRATGEPSDKIYDDNVYADTHENIPLDAWHRSVDLLVYEAGKSGLVDCYIVCPPLIYGKGNGPFNQESIQIPGLIRIAIKHKRAVHVGRGQNIWNTVHIEDLTDFFCSFDRKSHFS